MAQTTGTGTSWNLPNYSGELFTADQERTPFLSILGGLTGGGLLSESYEFPTAVLFDYPAPEQPEISETDSVTAPAPAHLTRRQEKNVVQIFHEAIDLTYVKQSNSGRLSGINAGGAGASPLDEKHWQIEKKLVKIARDVEYTFLNGKYQEATAANVANKTRGMFELCANGTTIDAGAKQLDKEMLDALYREMAANGAFFANMVMFLPAYQKQRLSEIYVSQLGAALPASRTVGGVNITTVLNDFFSFGVIWDPYVPDDSLLIADMAYVAPVFQQVPGKGILFEEELAKTGAADKSQIFGQIGLAHGPAFLHGTITGLAFS